MISPLAAEGMVVAPRFQGLIVGEGFHEGRHAGVERCAMPAPRDSRWYRALTACGGTRVSAEAGEAQRW